MNKTIPRLVIIILILVGGIILLSSYISKTSDVATQNVAINRGDKDSIAYNNTDYGFTLFLPTSWKGFSIVESKWQGTTSTDAVAPTGPKIVVRNPKWTEGAHYEDIPILVFTIHDWELYLSGGFSVSAAPIEARELGRNNNYVFALPPRWNFDYSLGYEEAEKIIESRPLR